MKASGEVIAIERVDVVEHAGAFMETAYSSEQVDAAIAIEIERGIDDAPCVFLDAK